MAPSVVPHGDMSSSTGAPGPVSAAPLHELSRTFRCIICLEDCTYASSPPTLRCAHPVCTPCLSDMFVHAIETSSEPFPRCPMPGCKAYASDRAVASIVPPHTLRRMRQLRGLKPARAADGRRMYCITEGCLEQLPPPPPPPPVPDENTEAGGGSEGGIAGEGAGGGSAPEEEEVEESLVSTCPECGTGVCMRCGCGEHGTEPCVKPLTCGRQGRLYHSYAVGRVSECPRCGVHIERNGGCNKVTCGHCRWSFDFRPFQSVEEAEQSTRREFSPVDVQPGQDNAFARWYVALFLMIWGSGFSSSALEQVVTDLVGGKGSWSLVIFVPFVGLGLPAFLLGVVIFLSLCIRALRDIGEEGALTVALLRAVIGGVILLVQHGLYLSDGSGGSSVKTWMWVIYFLPFCVCGTFLLFLAISHTIAVAMRAWRRWRHPGFVQVDEEDVESGSVEV